MTRLDPSHALQETLILNPSDETSTFTTPYAEVTIETAPRKGLPPCKKTSVPEAVFNMANLFIGLGLLAMPYSLKLGGWASLAALWMLGLAFYAAGECMISCLGRLPSAACPSYSGVGQHAFGEAGRVLVTVVTFTEYFGYLCAMVILVWRQLQAILVGVSPLDSLPANATLVIVAVSCLPALLIGNFKHMSRLSLMGIVCTTSLCTSVVAVVLSDTTRQHSALQPPPDHQVLSWQLPQAVGIFAMALTGPSGTALPTLRKAMKSAQEFPQVLRLGLLMMVAVYSLVGAMGYYYFGSACTDLITDDLMKWSPLSRVSIFHVTFDKLVSALIGFHAITTIAPVVLVLQDIGLTAARMTTPPRAWVLPVLRCLLFCGAVVIARYAASMLGVVESIIGSLCSISSGMLLPVAFYLRLQWHAIPWLRRVGSLLLIALGVTFIVLNLWQNIQAILAH